MKNSTHLPHQPVSQRLHENLRQIINSTAIGERLPSEPELAQRFGVSRATLREAMRTFETQGLIRRRQGAGTYVTPTTHIIETGLEVLESIETLAKRIGLTVTMGELKVTNRLSSKEETVAMGLENPDEVVSVSRVILAENRPVAYLIDILPKKMTPDAFLQADFTGSVLDLLLKRGDPPPMLSKTEILAVNAIPEVARSLGIQRGDVLLCFNALLYSHNGEVIDYSFSYFLPGYFKFHVLRQVGR